MAERSGSVDIQDLQDIRTPFGVPLSGIYKKSFAYVTIKDRLPVILTRVIDTLSRGKEEIAAKYGQAATEDVKRITGFISQLKNEIVTNKALKPLPPTNRADDDSAAWNEYLARRTELEGGTPTWFNTAWLYCECYMYRSLAQEFSRLEHLHDYDPFEKQKQEAFTGSLASIATLAAHTLNVAQASLTATQRREELVKLIKLNLWGNRCDLSLSAGADVTQSDDAIQQLQSYDKDILADDSDAACRVLENATAAIVDVVCDNAGYELFTDLCLAAFLTNQSLARKIRFYVKKYPWYVSDTRPADFRWTLEYMEGSGDQRLREMARLARGWLRDGAWSVEEEPYWTGPYAFPEMKARDPRLYAKLGEAALVIFKGDLNYRKLLADTNFRYETPFPEALGDFRPTRVLSLRTVKADVCVGLAAGVAEALFEGDENWMCTGRYGLVQLAAE